MALSRAIEVNEAWRAVKNPIKRAEALLLRLGVSSGETAEPNPSTDLLMEMMEAREELSEAARANDMAAVENLGKKMSFREREALAALGVAFDQVGASTEAARKLVHFLGELRYLRRFLDEVSAITEHAMEQ